MHKKLKNTIGFTALALYILALFMECYTVNNGASIGSFGLIALLLGWVNFDIIGLIWLANPLFIASLLFYFIAKKSHLIVIALNALACTLALLFLTVEEIIQNEAGHTGDITQLLPGYWLWVASICIILLGHILKSIFLKRFANRDTKVQL